MRSKTRYWLVIIGFLGVINLMANEDFLIYQGPGDQTWPDVCWDGQEFWVVWQDDTDGGIYGARVKSDGTILEPEVTRLTPYDDFHRIQPSLAFGDSILCALFRVIIFDTLSVTEYERFNLDGGIIDTIPQYAKGGEQIGVPSIQWGAPEIVFGRDHFLCFQEYAKIDLDYHSGVSVRAIQPDSELFNIWFPYSGFEYGATGVWNGESLLVIYGQWGLNGGTYGKFIRDSLFEQPTGSFKIRDFWPDLGSNRDKKISYNGEVYLLVAEEEDGSIWFDVIEENGTPTKTSPTIVRIPGIRYQSNPVAVWGGITSL